MNVLCIVGIVMNIFNNCSNKFVIDLQLKDFFMDRLEFYVISAQFSA